MKRSPISKRLRAKIEGAIERLIELLDAVDPDADAEPWLGATEGAGYARIGGWAGTREDLEVEYDDEREGECIWGGNEQVPA